MYSTSNPYRHFLSLSIVCFSLFITPLCMANPEQNSIHHLIYCSATPLSSTESSAETSTESCPHSYFAPLSGNDGVEQTIINVQQKPEIDRDALNNAYSLLGLATPEYCYTTTQESCLNAAKSHLSLYNSGASLSGQSASILPMTPVPYFYVSILHNRDTRQVDDVTNASYARIATLSTVTLSTGIIAWYITDSLIFGGITAALPFAANFIYNTWKAKQSKRAYFDTSMKSN